MTIVNQQLFELYSTKWNETSNYLMDIANGDPAPEPTNPLLIYVDDEQEWINADIRVMIFGQETNDYEGSPNQTIEHLLNVYDNFFNKGECWSYGGQFWNGIARFKALLGEQYPQKRVRYIWNNIIKIGKAGEKGRPPENIYEVERDCFHVIPDEIRILKPNVLLFLSGPNYDDAIRNNFGEGITFADTPPFNERQLAKVSVPDIDFAFRTYHPTYLWRNDIDSYFNAIVSEIKY
jgi:hypothetical protein